MRIINAQFWIASNLFLVFVKMVSSPRPTVKYSCYYRWFFNT